MKYIIAISLLLICGSQFSICAKNSQSHAQCLTDQLKTVSGRLNAYANLCLGKCEKSDRSTVATELLKDTAKVIGLSLLLYGIKKVFPISWFSTLNQQSVKSDREVISSRIEVRQIRGLSRAENRFDDFIGESISDCNNTEFGSRFSTTNEDINVWVAEYNIRYLDRDLDYTKVKVAYRSEESARKFMGEMDNLIEAQNLQGKASITQSLEFQNNPFK